MCNCSLLCNGIIVGRDTREPMSRRSFGRGTSVYILVTTPEYFWLDTDYVTSKHLCVQFLLLLLCKCKRNANCKQEESPKNSNIAKIACFADKSKALSGSGMNLNITVPIDCHCVSVL